MGYVKKRDVEHSADLLDQASQASELFLEEGVSKAVGRLQPEKHPDFDGRHCVDENCGVVMPKLRLQLGRIRCVDCQERREKLAKMGPR